MPRVSQIEWIRLKKKTTLSSSTPEFLENPGVDSIEFLGDSLRNRCESLQFARFISGIG